MRNRLIIIETPAEREGQAALLVDGRLEDLLIGPRKGDPTPRPGDIYWAKVDRLVPNAGGAFVRLTRAANGYLRHSKGLREGTEMLVQVVSHPEADKATPVTRRILVKGLHVILTPESPGANLSRAIRDAEERARLDAEAEVALTAMREAILEADLCGLILRTSSVDAAPGEIAEEAVALRRRWMTICEGARPGAAPARLHTVDLAETAINEWSSPGPVRVERGVRPVFEEHGVCDEIERLMNPRTDLPSGGWIAVEATAAVVAVDVNTGGDFSPAAGLKANLEAARELPRQLRLRGLGGQIVVDFAPMPKKDRKRLEDALKAAFRKDPIETSLAGWTTMGLFELQRKRERRPLSELLG